MDVIRMKDGSLVIGHYGKTERHATGYESAKGANQGNYVLRESVVDYVLHVVDGNSKTGKNVINLNFPIEYTCKHTCECYTEKACYAESGCYLYSDNQASYSENFNFFCAVDSETFCKAVQMAIEKMGFKLFRYFTCGDIVNYRFFECMVTIAKENPSVRFWSYTKKYEIVNRWLDENGTLPENLTIIFSHWLNHDGSYFPMDNRHNLPTSEFIPLGREELLETVTHVCPCSDPSVVACCEDCDHPCYELKNGQSMALCEHSTSATKERDSKLRKAHEELKKAKKAAKKAS